MRVTRAVAGVLLVGTVFVVTGIFLATQTNMQPGRDRSSALIFVGVGAVLVAESVFLFLRAKAKQTPVAPVFEQSSGPFGMDGARAVDETRVFWLNHGIVTIVVTGVAVVVISIGTALWIQPSVVAGIIGGAVGLALTAYIALALHRNNLAVGPPGITISGVWARKTIPWADIASLNTQDGRCIVRFRRTGRGRVPARIGNRDFTAYARVEANASMPGLIARYLNQRGSAAFGATPARAPFSPGAMPPAPSATPSPTPFIGATAPPPPPLSPTPAPPFWGAIPPPPPPPNSGQAWLTDRRAGFGIRLAAWSIDVIAIAVITFGVAVVIDAVLAGANGGTESNADATPALYAGFGITLVVYLVVCWHVGATLGMLMLRLRVIDSKSGVPPSWGRSLLRFVAALPSMVVFIPFGLVTVLGVDRLALHDRAARTVVVSIRNQGMAIPGGGSWPSG